MTSRIGKLPVDVPDGVTVELNNNQLLVKGQKGTLSFNLPPTIKAKVEDSAFIVWPTEDTKEATSLHGLCRSLVKNMVDGVKDGFEKRLEIVGTGYRAMQKGVDIEMNLGFSHPVLVKAPKGIQIKTEGQNVIVVSGIDKQRVGEMAANIRKIRPPEPYKGKGIRYQGERIKMKAGKAGK